MGFVARLRSLNTLKDVSSASSLLDPLLPHTAGECMAVHIFPVGDSRSRRRDLLCTLLCHLLVGHSLDKLSNPKPTGVSGGAVGRQDVIRTYGLVGVGNCRVLPEEERTIIR